MKSSFLKSIVIVLTLAVAPLTISNAQAAVKVGSYVGNWKASITYTGGDLITYSNKTFLSLVAKNKAKDPIKNPKVWQLLGGVGADGIQGIPGLQGPQGLTGSFTYSNTCGVNGTDACKIGAVGPGGGWIFFVDYSDQYLGFNYLEAAPSDTSPGIWCNNVSSSIPAVANWASKGVGKGQSNTTAMLGVCASGAANVADLYLTATKSDWFLPSLGEVKLMYDNLLDAGVGDFGIHYWSSTEYASNYAWLQYFDDGTQNALIKSTTLRVRPVRSF